MQSAQDRSRTVPFDDQVVAGELAPIFHQAVHAGIVQRADHDVHRLRHQRVSESAELPVAEMRGGKKHAPAGLLRFQIMFKPFVTYPLTNVLAIQFRKTRENPNQAGDGEKNFVRNRAALSRRFLRVRQLASCASRCGAGAGWQDREAPHKSGPDRAVREPATREGQPLFDPSSNHPKTRSPS